tara:strand:- start:231 stop:728 length:498 start_codon:yes stop_codon:yes gene_type:complete
MKIKKAFLLLFIIPLLSFSAHKYYLSLTQIEYKNESKSIQIIINVFMDDIETALNKEYSIDLQLTNQNELESNDVYFKKYLKKNLYFKVDNTSSSFNYIGKEYDGDLVYFYLEIENVNSLEAIEVVNTILIDYFPEQQNLIKSKVNKKHNSILLTKTNDKGLLKF